MIYQKSLASMKSVVDACMLFCGLTGMHCNIGKCRWMATAGTDVGLGILSGVHWLLHGRWGVVAGKRERFEKVDLDEVWRYLGMIQNGDGNCDQMMEQLRLQVDEAAAILSRKKIFLALRRYLPLERCGYAQRHVSAQVIHRHRPTN
jgi:hypothetical protein